MSAFPLPNRPLKTSKLLKTVENVRNRLNKVSVIAVASGIVFLAAVVEAQVPGIINYQGRVVDNGTNFTGTGQFEFGLINGTSGTTNYWANDGTAAGQPGLAVPLPVTNGLYSVLLGDTTVSNMTVAIPATLFTNTDVRLRVWFNDGVSGFQQLSPDQRLAAVGYAMMAASVPAGAIGSAQLASNAVTAAAIANGAVGSSQLASNAISAADLVAPLAAQGVVTNGQNSLQLAGGSIQFNMVGTVTNAGSGMSISVSPVAIPSAYTNQNNFGNTGINWAVLYQQMTNFNDGWFLLYTNRQYGGVVAQSLGCTDAMGQCWLLTYSAVTVIFTNSRLTQYFSTNGLNGTWYYNPGYIGGGGAYTNEGQGSFTPSGTINTNPAGPVSLGPVSFPQGATGPGGAPFLTTNSALFELTNNLPYVSTNNLAYVLTNNLAYVLTNSLAYVNVMDFGATGDGTTDDSVAIASADAAAASAGQAVFFPDPPARYLVHSNLTPQAHRWFGESSTAPANGCFGLGACSSINFVGTGTCINARGNWSGSGFRLDDIQLWGPGTAIYSPPLYGTNNAGSVGIVGRNCYIENVFIGNFDTGLYLPGAYNALVIGGTYEYNNTGIAIDNNAGSGAAGVLIESVFCGYNYQQNFLVGAGGLVDDVSILAATSYSSNAAPGIVVNNCGQLLIQGGNWTTLTNVPLIVATNVSQLIVRDIRFLNNVNGPCPGCYPIVFGGQGILELDGIFSAGGTTWNTNNSVVLNTGVGSPKIYSINPVDAGWGIDTANGVYPFTNYTTTSIPSPVLPSSNGGLTWTMGGTNYSISNQGSFSHSP